MQWYVDYEIYQKYETQRSYYFIDIANKRYMRLPKNEGGRLDGLEDPSPMMIDNRWHDLEDSDEAVKVVDTITDGHILLIRYKDCTFGILTTPLIPVPELEDVADALHRSN